MSKGDELYDFHFRPFFQSNSKLKKSDFLKVP